MHWNVSLVWRTGTYWCGFIELLDSASWRVFHAVCCFTFPSNGFGVVTYAMLQKKSFGSLLSCVSPLWGLSLVWCKNMMSWCDMNKMTSSRWSNSIHLQSAAIGLTHWGAWLGWWTDVCWFGKIDISSLPSKRTVCIPHLGQLARVSSKSFATLLPTRITGS